MDKRKATRLCKELRELNEGRAVCINERIWAYPGAPEVEIDYDGFAEGDRSDNSELVKGSTLEEVTELLRHCIQEMKGEQL